MTDVQWLLLVLAAIYLSECCFWVPRASLVFRSVWSFGSVPVFPSRAIGNDRGGLVWLNPLPPFGSAFICQFWPVSITEEAMYAYVAQSLDPAGRHEQMGTLWAFSEVKRVWAESADVIVNGRIFLRTRSAESAKQWARFLTDIWRAPIKDRRRLIDDHLGRRFDLVALRNRLELCRAQTRGSLTWRALLFVILFVLLPTAAWLGRIGANLILLVPGILICIGVCMFRFYEAYQRLYADLKSSRWRSVLILFFTPTANIRWNDLLTRDLLTDYDPIAIAAVLCKPQEFRRFGREMLLDLANPRRPVCPSSDHRAETAEHIFRQVLEAKVRSFLRELGYDLNELCAPPAPIEINVKSYCPRCEQPFIVDRGRCDECGGIPLDPFPEMNGT